MNSRLLAIPLALLLALSGCIAGEDDTPPTDDIVDEVPVILGPGIEAYTGAIANSVSTPLITVSSGDQFPLNRTGENITGYVLELTWTANDATTESLDLWIRRDADFAIASANPDTVLDNRPTVMATGTSPLRLAFTADQLAEDQAYAILVRSATPAGVAVEQAWDLQVAVFDGIAHDPEFAFDAEDESEA